MGIARSHERKHKKGKEEEEGKPEERPVDVHSDSP